MCYHRSYLVTEDFKVHSHPRSDHHTDIRAYAGIREEGFHHTTPHAGVEYNPVLNLFDVENGWSLTVDEKIKPKWWTNRHNKVAFDKLISDFKFNAAVDSRVYRSSGSVEIPYLRQLQPGSIVIAKDTLLLVDVGPFLEDVTLIADVIRWDPQGIKELNRCRISCTEFQCPNSAFESHLYQTNQLLTVKPSRFYRSERDRYYYDQVSLDQAAMQEMQYAGNGPFSLTGI
jgi:hypothetical protein